MRSRSQKCVEEEQRFVLYLYIPNHHEQFTGAFTDDVTIVARVNKDVEFA